MSGEHAGAVTFDLFGTLVSVRRPADPAAAVADELETRGIPVPDDWTDAYATPHADVEPGREVPLPEHVRAALEWSGVDLDSAGVDSRDVSDAVRAAFDGPVAVRDGADEAIEAARERGSVGVLSNCSVPGLVERTLDRIGSGDRFDAVVASVDVGFRKPDPRAFAAAADRLGVDPADLVHVGDDPETDGGVAGLGGTVILLEETPLSALSDRLREEGLP